MTTIPSVRFVEAAGLDNPGGPESTPVDTAGADGTLARAKAGEAGAFARLVRIHQRSVYGLALRALGSRMEAEDVAQDVFLQLHLDLDRLESPSHLAFWLRRTVSHRVIDRLRQRRRNPESAGTGALAALDAAESSGTDSLLVRRLEKLVAELPPVPRFVVALRYQEDLDPVDIAELLDLSVNTVKSHLKRSLARLRARCNGRDPR